MTKYRVNFTTVASAGIKIEADSADEAIEKADEIGIPGLCAQCSGWGREIGIDLGEWEPDERYPVDVIEEA